MLHVGALPAALGHLLQPLELVRELAGTVRLSRFGTPAGGGGNAGAEEITRLGIRHVHYALVLCQLREVVGQRLYRGLWTRVTLDQF